MAGGGCEGLRSPDSALAAPPAPCCSGWTVSSQATLGGGAGHRRDFFFFFADEPKPKNHSGMDGEGQLATDAERVPSAPWTAPRLGKAKEGQRQDSSSPLLVPAGSGETSVTPLAATSKHCLCL